MRIRAYVGFSSSLPLEDVAERVSTSLLGGMAFVGKQEFLKDEVPAVRSFGQILGLRVVLQGAPESGYLMDIYPQDPTDTAFRVEAFEDEIDLSPLVASLLGRIPDVSNVKTM